MHSLPVVRICTNYSRMPEHELVSSKSHLKAVLQSLLVTFLWSTSWVLIKIGLKASLPAITFAGLRYSLAFLCLLPFVIVHPSHRATIQSISHRTWMQLVLLGLVLYTLTQGAQFLGLAYLPAATLTLLLNFSPILVALSSRQLTHEPATVFQWGGIFLSVIGAMVYFFPVDLPSKQFFGLAVGVIGLLANSAASLLGRQINNHSGLEPIIITTVSMGIGGLVLLAAGATTQGFGKLDLMQWLIIAWLAIINTAFAFTLWNHTLRTLTAVESSIINNTMMPQIAILAWLFLAEPLNPKQIVGILLVGGGTLIVQLGPRLRAG